MEKPKPIKVKDFLMSPLIMRRIESSPNIIVENTNYLVLAGQNIYSEEPLRIGEEVTLCFDRSYNIVIYYVKEEKAYKEYLREKYRRECEEKENALRQKSDDFWAKNPIPFNHTIEIKEVLSGLSVGGYGNGMKKNTVYHVFLHEDFQKGKLIRRAGDFLCQNSKSKHGGNWSNSLGDGNRREIKPIVTCKKCLEMMAKI